MLLLILPDGHRNAIQRPIYIPLCFYLYDLHRRAVNPQIHLHSTMLLLIPQQQVIVCLSCSFTFHYASTYTGTGALQNLPRKNIYIPLCFYLYGYVLDARQGKTHLHSTMLLLILTGAIVAVLSYILFTFHYASTYTQSAALLSPCEFPFTFHYASTYTAAQRHIYSAG